MVCQDCKRKCRKHGINRNGTQRFRCSGCKKTYSEERESLFGDMRVPEETALMALHLLCEGSSVRATSRVTGLHKATILKLLVHAGQLCERLLAERIVDVPVKDVACDEVWSFVGCKEKRKREGGVDPQWGDAYCFIALESSSKLVLAWHLDRRTSYATDAFLEKLERATSGHFMVSTDGYACYPESMSYHLGARTDYGVLVKYYGKPADGERAYSPGTLTSVERTKMHGNPDESRICTSYVERFNLSLRTSMRRWTRLTCAFSKCWRNHKAAVALFIAFYNFCTIHRSIKVTPAMAAGIAQRPWSLRDLLGAALAAS